jgi:hypothetical protein
MAIDEIRPILGDDLKKKSSFSFFITRDND